MLQSAACDVPLEAGQSNLGQGEHGRSAAAEQGLPTGATDQEVGDDSMYDDASEVPLPSGRTVYGKPPEVDIQRSLCMQQISVSVMQNH